MTPTVSLPDGALVLHGGRFAAFDDGQLGAADAECPPDLPFDLGEEIGVFADEDLRVLASLAEAHVAVREPGARLLDDLVVEADVDQLAGLRDALAVADVDLRLPERCGALVLDDLHFHARANHLFAFLDLVRAANVEADRRVELQRAAAGRRVGIAEHDADLFADLVDENHTRF